MADSFLTKYELQDNYTAGLKKISDATKDFGKTLDDVKGSDGGDGSGVGLMGFAGALRSLPAVSNPAVLAIGAIGAALGLLTIGAVKATIELAKFGFESMRIAAPQDSVERTFRGIYGSVEKAAQMMGFLRQEAAKSPFDFENLAQSAKLLTLSGLSFSEFNESMQAIAARGGGNMGQNLEQVASTIQRIKAGDFAQAFENLRSFGIGKDQLIAAGATFDAGGQFTGSIEQALEVVKKIGASGKGVLKEMSDGMDAVLSNFDAAMKQIMVTIGLEVFNNFKPLIIGITDFINKVIGSGVIQDTVKAISNIFGGDLNTSFLVNIVASVAAVIQTAAQVAQFIVGVVERLISWVQNTIGKIPGMSHMIGAIAPGANMFTNTIGSLFNNNFNANASKLANSTSAVYTEPELPKTATPSTVDAVVKEAAKEVSQEVAKAIVDKPGGTMARIADSTRQTAEHTKVLADMTRHILGGGDIGRLGLTQYEMNGINMRSANKPIRVKIDSVRTFEQIIEDVTNSALIQLKRQGAF